MSGMISAVITVCAGALICSLLSAFVPEGTTKKTVALGLTVIRNEITYQLLADGFRVHTKLPSDS